jgi:hypothetical protein|tara:strand:+ start:5670 stop:5849 length:180 start_codon:yes stop_codon:yes gene_type:complete
MKFPEHNPRTGLTTTGLTGVMIMSGVIFSDLSAYWLILATLLIVSAIGLESGRTDSNNS